MRNCIADNIKHLSMPERKCISNSPTFYGSLSKGDHKDLFHHLTIPFFLNTATKKLSHVSSTCVQSKIVAE